MNKQTKIAIGVVGVLAILVILGFVFKPLLFAAFVDGHPITRVALTRELDKQYGSKTLDTMINNVLIDNEAKTRNIEIKDSDIEDQLNKIKSSVEAAGQNFNDALKQENITLDQLKRQIKIEQQLKALLGDKIKVTDQEIDQYISDYKLTLSEETGVTRDSIRSDLEQQKLSQQANQFIADLKAKAHIQILTKFE